MMKVEVAETEGRWYVGLRREWVLSAEYGVESWDIDALGMECRCGAV